jgi:hypothetical protein
MKVMRRIKNQPGTGRRIAIRAFIRREGGYSRGRGRFLYGFTACVGVGKAKTGVSTKTLVCSNHNNPRKALAFAMAKAARKISHRGGAFAGMR